MRLVMMQNPLCVYNASGQIFISIIGAFVESPKASKVNGVGMSGKSILA